MMARQLSQRGLQAFRMVMLTGGSTPAAATMNLSQPAVSRLLRDLEADTGLELFARVRGRLVPTQEGRLFFEEVQRAFIGHDRLLAAAREIGAGRRGALVVGCLPAVGATLLPRLVRAHMAAAPGGAVRLHVGTSERVSQWVMTRDCDLGIVSVAVPRAGLRFEREYRMPCLCILPAGHRLCGRAAVEIADLQGERLVRLSPGETLIGMQMEALLEQHGVELAEPVEATQSILVSGLVREGLGLGVVDALTAAAHVAAGGVALPFRPEISFGFGIVSLDGAALGAPQASFLAGCDACLGQVPEVEQVARQRRGAGTG
jgi:DNA-binding transcriptional LysR family regulator